MKENPLKNDWIHLVEKDKSDLDIYLNDQTISKLSKFEFTSILESEMRKYVFRQLQDTKEGHIKVKHIIHSDLKNPQSYLTSQLFTHKQSSLLLNLRCLCVNEFKSNFYTSICPVCKSNPDTQEHAIVCPSLKQHIKQEHISLFDGVNYSDLYSTVDSQLKLTRLFEIIIKTRIQLRTSTSLPRHHSRPSG